MQFEPMIKARINSFKTHHALSNIPEDKLFELFVNDVVLRSHQPDVGISEEVILDECSVGGADDMGIDGLAIKVNGIFVSTKQDIDELVELNKQISIEFLFIQSKNKDKLDSGEYGKFADGIIDFLADEHHEPHNEKIEAILQLKDYLFSDDIILRWKRNPIVRIYYIIFGQWRDNKHFEAKTNKLKQDIIALQSYSDAFFKFIDNTELKKMCGENENSYARDNKIPSTRIIGLKTLTQSFVSVFMQSPHFGTSHEAILLKKYKNSIYVDGQSLYPYYTAALMCLNFEKLKRDEKIVRALDNHKHHLLFIVSELIAGVCPSINDSKKIDAYCNKILEIVSDDTTYTAAIQESSSKLQKAIAEWVRKRGQQYRHGIKDNPAFTKFLLTFIRGGNLDKIEYDNPQPLVLRGRIVKARRDRNGYNYGFIQHSPEDVFFHERDNEKLDFSSIYGKTVLYEIFPDSLNGEDRAEILEVLADESYLI